MRRFLLPGLALAVAAAAVYVFFFLAAAFEARTNVVLQPPPYEASERARELHAQLFVADLHADTLLWDRALLARGTAGHVDVPRLIDGNVGLQMFTIPTKVPTTIELRHNDSSTDAIRWLALAERWPIGTWTSYGARALHMASRLTRAADASNGALTVIRSGRDLTRYLERRGTTPRITAGLLGLEGAHALDGQLELVDQMFDAGIRMVAPTHLADNEMGGSGQGVSGGGLTTTGRALIRRLEATHMLVDLAHSSPRALNDALSLATRPIVVSHTGVAATCPNPRNLTDDQLRAIAANGGVVGIGFWETATCGRDAHAIARAVRHAATIMGIEHVALGSDFDGAVATPFDATGMALVTDALLANGFNEVEIHALMGGNVVRLLLAVLPER